MKLCMPAGLENSFMNEKVSPIIGQPSLPGIAAIAFEEAHVCSKAESKTIDIRMAATTNIFSSIDCHKTEDVDGWYI